MPGLIIPRASFSYPLPNGRSEQIEGGRLAETSRAEVNEHRGLKRPRSANESDETESKDNKRARSTRIGPDVAVVPKDSHDSIQESKENIASATSSDASSWQGFDEDEAWLAVSSEDANNSDLSRDASLIYTTNNEFGNLPLSGGYFFNEDLQSIDYASFANDIDVLLTPDGRETCTSESASKKVDEGRVDEDFLAGLEVLSLPLAPPEADAGLTTLGYAAENSVTENTLQVQEQLSSEPPEPTFKERLEQYRGPSRRRSPLANDATLDISPPYLEEQYPELAVFLDDACFQSFAETSNDALLTVTPIPRGDHSLCMDRPLLPPLLRLNFMESEKAMELRADVEYYNYQGVLSEILCYASPAAIIPTVMREVFPCSNSGWPSWGLSPRARTDVVRFIGWFQHFPKDDINKCMAHGAPNAIPRGTPARCPEIARGSLARPRVDREFEQHKQDLLSWLCEE
ncbi:hypothetical protein C8Q79DRAFT_924118 [Trametes meyenii]|nr:hypothetical protein C8Q79DRAFT_924118 [Trametes meyenii]